MAECPAQQLEQIKAAIESFASQPVLAATIRLLQTLGYSSDKTVALGKKPAEFVANLKQFGKSSLSFFSPSNLMVKTGRALRWPSSRAN